MKRLLNITLSLLLAGLTGTVIAQSRIVVSNSAVACDRWVTTAFARGKVPPFSFLYGGKPSAAMISRWKYAVRVLSSAEAGVALREYRYTDPSTGMEVRCDVKTFADFNAMEWALHFRNTSHRNSLKIEAVKVVDLHAASPSAGIFQLHYANGSTASKSDFQAFTDTLTVGHNRRLHSTGGRSSQEGFPFFNMQLPQGGLVAAVGWTGNWYADITREEATSVTLATGMTNLSTYLLPNEEIRTPSTALLLWSGDDRMTGQNLLRRFLLRYHHPKVEGKPARFPLSFSFNYGDPAPCNEYSCMTAEYAVALVRRYEQFGLIPEVFWLDAGWYDKSGDWQHNHNWANTVGNWSVDSIRFPKGFVPIADEVHRLGCKFMVWFEPERVMKDSRWAIEHPEFMLDAAGKAAQPDWIKHSDTDSYLFNLGDPVAREWLCEQIARLIRENKIDYYRQDFNIEPEGFWQANDAKDRQGICEIRYIEGLYAFWDYLRQTFPSLLIDNCASGGRRIDLETTSRSAPLWRTDYHYGEPIGYQCHTYGLNLWLPVHGTGSMQTEPFTSRSSLGAAVVINWKITSADFSIPEMQLRKAEWEAVRPYFLEDYYPLTGFGDTTRDDIWLAYQLNRPSDGSGYVVAFRRGGAANPVCEVRLRGVDPSAKYLLHNADGGDPVEVRGKELMEHYALRLDQPRSSLLIKYDKE